MSNFAGPADGKLSWEDTARAIAPSVEGWAEWTKTDLDGLDSVPWESSGSAPP